MTFDPSQLMYAGCAVACAAWALVILRSGIGRAGWFLAAPCAATSLWAALVAASPDGVGSLTRVAAAAEVLRSLAWLVLLLDLARRIAGFDAALVRRFAVAGLALGLVGLAATFPGLGEVSIPSLGSPGLLGRLALAFAVVLLAENLYRNADADAAWHVVLPCIALGGLAAFDVLAYADAVLLRDAPATLLDGRPILAALVLPLLVVAALRRRRWRGDLPISRQAAFHGATLLVGGTFLFGVGMAGEALRRLGSQWGAAAQASLFAAAVIAMLVALTSGSARSRLRRLVVDPLFNARFDYHREWMRCIAALSGASNQHVPAPVRSVNAVADVVDSPAGAVLLREPDAPAWRWAGSWNLPAAPALSIAPDHALPSLLRSSAEVAAGADLAAMPDLAGAFGPLWLAIPLIHHREGVIGAVLLAPPRVPFELDREVFDLLLAIGREVGLFLSERQAAEQLADARGLRDYAQRFAFVAHDVKTVAGGLQLLLANAQDNISDPEFQQDMLTTVRAAADRINLLLARLREPEPAGNGPAAPAPAAVPAIPAVPTGKTDLGARLRVAAQAQPQLVNLSGTLPADTCAAMPAEAFDSVLRHLLDNAVEASPPGERVSLRLSVSGGRAQVDVADRGHGMTPEFVRDHLFRPLVTSKPGGNGIGAWQARELVRQAGGELVALSEPGVGTTMRITLPACPPPTAAPEAASRGNPLPLAGIVHA